MESHLHTQSGVSVCLSRWAILPPRDFLCLIDFLLCPPKINFIQLKEIKYLNNEIKSIKLKTPLVAGLPIWNFQNREQSQYPLFGLLGNSYDQSSKFIRKPFIEAGTLGPRPLPSTFFLGFSIYENPDFNLKIPISLTQIYQGLR